MSLTASESLLIVLVAAISVFATRIVPFLLFSSRNVPAYVNYLGKILPPAVIAILIVYCLKGIKITTFPSAIPELIAITLVIFVHLWKRNNLLSISVGTVVYMLLIQCIFNS